MLSLFDKNQIKVRPYTYDTYHLIFKQRIDKISNKELKDMGASERQIESLRENGTIESIKDNLPAKAREALRNYADNYRHRFYPDALPHDLSLRAKKS